MLRQTYLIMQIQDNNVLSIAMPGLEALPRLASTKHRRQCTTRPRPCAGSVSGLRYRLLLVHTAPCCNASQVGEQYYYCVRYYTIAIHSRCPHHSLLHSEGQDLAECCFPGTTTRIPSQFTFAVPCPLFSLARSSAIDMPASTL